VVNLLGFLLFDLEPHKIHVEIKTK